MIKPYLHVYQTATHGIPGGSEGAAIAFNQKLIDTLGVFNTAAGKNTVYVPNIPGWYDCFGQVAFANTVLTGGRAAQFRKNGARTDQAPYSGANPAREDNDDFFASIVQCKATILCNGTTDSISLRAAQNTVASLATFYGSGLTHCYMIIQWAAPAA